MSERKEIVAKLVLAGTSGVGKTSISNRAFEGAFEPGSKPTIGSGFMKGSLNTSLGRVTLEVWDTAGQEQFTSLAPVFFSNASAAILVYDLTERNSLYAIERYLSMISDRASENCIICLVGNKKDLVENDSSKREVSPEESIRFGSKIGAKYILEVSALSGENINDIFLSIANDPDLVGASSQEESIIKPETNKGGKSCC